MELLTSWTGRVTSVLFDVALGLVFLATWLRPDSPPAAPVAFLLLIMLVEFILIHGTVWLETVWFSRNSVSGRLKTMTAVSGLYMLFGVGMSVGFSSWFPILAVAILGANRMLSVIFDPHPDPVDRKAAERRWARDVGLYLLAVFSTIFVPYPELGIDAAHVAGLGLPGSGHWISEPHTVMAAGFLYFGARAFFELRDAIRTSAR